MTAQADAARLARPPRARRWYRAGVISLLAIAAIFVFGVAFVVGYARIHEGRVLPGVDVAGVSLAGLDRAAAERELRRVLPDLGLGTLTVRIGSREQTVAYADIGRDYDMAAMLDEAVAAGSGQTPAEALGQPVRILLDGLSISPAVVWDSELLTDQVTAIALAAEVEPVDATIFRPDGAYTFSPAVNGQDVDVQAVVRLAVEAVDNLSPASAEIQLDPITVAPAVSTDHAQTAADLANAIMARPLTVRAMGESATVGTQRIADWVRLEEVSAGEWVPVIDRAQVEQFVEELKATADVPALDASFTFEAGEPVVLPATAGVVIDEGAAVSAILAALEGRSSGPSEAVLDLALLPIAPEFTTPQAQAVVSRVERLSAWTTGYVASSRNGFGVNIRRPTSLIDGTVVAPGELFDFVAVASPITEENGYTSGAAIINGNTRLDGVLGGGLCSTSTTLFNAALRAGFEIGARRAHAYFIDRYPVGLDATIWINGGYVQTMSFTNDSAYPILIRGINRSDSVTFEIWGVADGRRVAFTDPIVWNERKAWTEVEYTDDLAPGATERVEFPFDGFSSLVTRTVSDIDRKLLHEDTFRSSYRRVIGLLLLGRSPGDPPAGTRVRLDGAAVTP